MKRANVGLAGLIVFMVLCTGTSTAQDGLTPDKSSRKKLKDGNTRYVDANLSHPNLTVERRTEVAKKQYPFAAVVSCSDSRVPPEIIFDQGLGDLFVIRLAGNILNDEALGSLEYAVEHLGVQYIRILGHERCGAVDAAVQGGEAHGHIGSLVKAIQPAVDKVKNQPGDVLDNAIRTHIMMVVQQVKSSKPILKEAFERGALTIDGARYDLDEGVVEFLH